MPGDETFPCLSSSNSVTPPDGRAVSAKSGDRIKGCFEGKPFRYLLHLCPNYFEFQIMDFIPRRLICFPSAAKRVGVSQGLPREENGFYLQQGDKRARFPVRRQGGQVL